MTALTTLPRAVRSLIIAALSVRLIDEWWSYLPGGVMENLRTDLSFSYTSAGSLISIAVLSGLIGGPLGALADIFDRRLVAVIGSALQTVGMILFAAGRHWIILAIGVTLLGAAGDLVIRPLEAALAESLPEDELENALGSQHFLSFIGDFIGPVTLGAAALAGVSWRSVFWFTAASLSAYTVFIATVRFPPRHADSPDNDTMPIRSVIRQRSVWKLVLADILLFPLDEPIAAFAIAAIALDTPKIAQGIGIGYVIGGLASSAAIGRNGLNARTKRGPLILIGGAAGVTLAIAATTTETVPYNAGVIAAALSMTVVGIGMGFVWGDLHHQQLTVIPGRAATVASVIGTVSAIGALWPWLGGIISDQHGITYTLALFTLSAVALGLLLRTPSRYAAT